MTKYGIEVIYTPINGNPERATKRYIYGKSCTLLTDIYNPLKAIPKWLIDEYGYNRMCDAKKGLKSHIDLAKFETSYNNFWDIQCQIIIIAN